jgi:predicted metal-dependent hydrolase
MSAGGMAVALKARNRWHDAEELRWAVRHWATKIGVRTPQIHLREMRTKWASLSMIGRLTLNTELLDLPKDLSEFVIVHELVHILAPNHGKVFKSFMHAYLPDWDKREEELQKLSGSGFTLERSYESGGVRRVRQRR